jgi:predicted permease
MSETVRDLVYAARRLKKAPLFTLTAALSLAIGIAGNAAVFSVADALLLRDRPGIADPQRLVDVARTQNGTGFDNLSYPNYVDYRDRATAFAGGLAGYKRNPDALGLGGRDGAERVFGTAVTGNYFQVLGVPMAAGRGFAPEDDRPGAEPATVLTHALWRDRYAGDPAIVGRTIRLNGRPFTVIGVAAEEFAGHTVAGTDLWYPLTLHPELLPEAGRFFDMLTTRRAVWMMAVGRLDDSVTLQQARAQLTGIAADLARTYPDDNENQSVAVLPLSVVPGDVRGATSGYLGVLFGLVGVILLIACTNVGGMLLARSVGRAREVAIRLALGSDRGRIVRMLVTEAVLLGGLGAAAGVAGAVGLIRLVRSAVPVLPIPVIADVRLDWRVIGFSLVLALLTGVLFGLIPALEAARTDLVGAMKVDASSRPRRQRLRQAFVVAQVAMSVLLVVCALLLGRSLRNADSIDTGFVSDGVYLGQLNVRLAGHDDEAGLRVADDLVAGMLQTPGVIAAATTRIVPLSGSGLGLGGLRLPGQPRTPETTIRADWNVITPGYFDTLQIPIRRGRTFTEADRGATTVAIVNETFAARAWPGRDPVGERLTWDSIEGEKVIEIVGVAGDAKYRSIGEPPRPFIYVPLAQQFMGEMWLVARATGPNPIPAMRDLILRRDPDLPLTQAGTLDELTAFALLPHRAAAWIAGAVGVIGLLLACIGVYGITAHSVTQRAREIGIRVALGALRSRVLAMVVRQAMLLAAAGAALGLTAAAFATQLLTAYLYGLEPLDPVSFAGGALLLAVLALAASLVPACRAALVDPVTALRSE